MKTKGSLPNKSNKAVQTGLESGFPTPFSLDMNTYHCRTIFLNKPEDKRWGCSCIDRHSGLGKLVCTIVEWRD